jgi:hypothetical protein
MAIVLEELIVAALPEILSFLQNAATSAQLNAIEQDVVNLTTYVGQVNQDIDTRIQALYQVLQQLQFDIQNPVQQPQPPVTLPPTPPPGYGGGSSSDTASAVWNYVFTAGPYAESALSQVWVHLGSRSGAESLPFPGQPFLKMVAHGYWGDSNPALPNPRAPLDPATILPTDASAQAWVSRAYSGYGWFTGFINGVSYFAYPDLVDPHLYWALDLPPYLFRQLQAASASSVPQAPVWPGLAGVTLGTPVPISVAFDVVGPLHGVIVSLTAVSPKKATFDINGNLSHRNIGTLAFVDDNGDAENFQILRFMHEVFTPKSMAVASKASFNCDVDDAGTVTPFTIP